MKNRIIFALFLAASAFGQTDAGAIRVLVTDPSGLAITDAKVTLANVATGVQSVRTSAGDGYAMFTPVAAGRYTVEVGKAGFQQTRVNDLSIDVDERKL